ncbi:MAG: VCBS repeat-containing protein, partial [Acidobacteria bacterium]|nr:VCBS repeat-containing protein [Acidobacteriota bacterium]
MHKIAKNIIVLLIALLTPIALRADSYTPLTQTRYTFSGSQTTAFYYHGLNYTTPALGDFDGDGDLDLIVGNLNDYLTYFRNDGSASNMDPGAISPTIIKIPGETRLTPYPGDLDGDGDMDLVVGTASGKIYFVENTGVTSGMPDFVLDTTPIATAISYCHPALDDADGDSDLDLFVGQGTAVAFYRNTGSATAPSFSLEQSNVVSTTSIDHLTPCLVDIDGDGDAEMFCGESNGEIAYYDKVVNGSDFSYNLVTSAYGGISIGQYSTCFFADTNNDGNADIACGNRMGKSSLYLSSGGASPTYTVTTDNFGYFDIGTASSYKLIDMDGDGDLDMLATVNNVIEYFRNNGPDPANPDWELVSANLLTTTYRNLSLETWDYDRDGDLDIIFGNDSGGIGLLKNTGTASAPVFTEIYVGYRYNTSKLFDGMKVEAPYSSIRMVDVDGDGDKDAVIVSGWGTSAYYRNDDINVNQGGTDETLDPWQPDNFVLVRYGASISSSYFPFGTGTNGRIAAWDIDGDGDTDFLNTSILTTISLIRNTGTLTSASYTRETINYANISFNTDSTESQNVTIDMADMDGDGWPDLVLGGASGGLKIYLNDAADDTMAPAAPANFTATAARHDRVMLRWDRVTDVGGTGVAKYVIKRNGSVVHEIPTP